MNRSSSKNGKVGRRRKSARRGTQHEEWLKELYRRFSVYRSRKSSGLDEVLVVYRDGLSPARMPTPGGPSPGAKMTTVEMVRGTDMTLPSGSAITGALLRQGGSTDLFASFAFAAADVPNIASLGAAFDAYRIEEIQFRLKSHNNAVYIAGTASPNNGMPSPLIAVDQDDNTTPSTLSEVQQYDNCNQISAQDNLDIIFTPAITPSIFSGGVFNGYSIDADGKTWLDLANTGSPHYGIKVALPALVASTTYKWDWEFSAWYKISFRRGR